MLSATGDPATSPGLGILSLTPQARLRRVYCAQMKRAYVNLPNGLYRLAKAEADRRGFRFSAYVALALEAALVEAAMAKRKKEKTDDKH